MKPVVLVVDDDAAVREALHLVLDGEHTMLEACDGAQTLEILGSRPVDLVLLDLLMPGVDGIEVLRELKDRHPRLPVIVLTGVKILRTAVDAMRLGAADYITKPFRDEDLLAAIGRSLRAISTTRVTLLLFEPDLGRRAALTVVLERFGAVEAVATLDQLRERARLAAPAWLVIDAGASAEAARRTIRELRAGRSGCRFVVALSHAGVGLDGDEGLGIDRIIRSPIGVAELVGALASALTWPGPRLSPRAAEAIEYLRANYAEAVTVDKVARAVDISASHLAHAFREQTGMSVLEFLGRLRVEVAKILLVTTDAKLAGVATLTGFFDAGHLARAFRRRAGASPGSYRLRAG